jgi:hypothetical protein
MGLGGRASLMDCRSHITGLNTASETTGAAAMLKTMMIITIPRGTGRIGLA